MAGTNRTPERAVLFYATDDEQAQAVVSGLSVLRASHRSRPAAVDAALRIEMCGDLHEYGGLNGKPVIAEQARAALAKNAK